MLFRSLDPAPHAVRQDQDIRIPGLYDLHLISAQLFSVFVQALATAEIHTVHDLLPTLSEKQMRKNVEFAVRIIRDVANAAVLPVKKGMSEECRKELDKYFHREKEKETK